MEIVNIYTNSNLYHRQKKTFNKLVLMRQHSRYRYRTNEIQQRHAQRTHEVENK